MAKALGVRFYDKAGHEIEDIPERLADLDRVFPDIAIDLPEIVVASDVNNPLLGESGATKVFGAQKGIHAEEIELHESRLKAFADVVEKELQISLRNHYGAGAAGGLGFGLMCFAGGRLRNGFNMVADALGLAMQIAGVDFVVTGEGSLDAQTLQGKAPMGLALLAREHGKKVIGVGGRVDPIVADCQWFDATLSLESFGLSEDECMFRAEELVRKLGGEVAGLLRHWEDE